MNGFAQKVELIKTSLQTCKLSRSCSISSLPSHLFREILLGEFKTSILLCFGKATNNLLKGSVFLMFPLEADLFKILYNIIHILKKTKGMECAEL